MLLLDDLAEREVGVESSFSAISKSVRTTRHASLQLKLDFFSLFVHSVVFFLAERFEHEMADHLLALGWLWVLLLLASAEIE